MWRSIDVWMTPECRELFGYQADEPVGLNRFLESVHPDDRRGCQARRERVVAQGGR